MKIKDKFTDEEHKMFVASFYCFLKYNPTSDFVIDMHYKALVNQQVKQTKGVIIKKFICFPRLRRFHYKNKN